MRWRRPISTGCFPGDSIDQITGAFQATKATSCLSAAVPGRKLSHTSPSGRACLVPPISSWLNSASTAHSYYNSCVFSYYYSLRPVVRSVYGRVWDCSLPLRVANNSIYFTRMQYGMRVMSCDKQLELSVDYSFLSLLGNTFRKSSRFTCPFFLGSLLSFQDKLSILYCSTLLRTFLHLIALALSSSLKGIRRKRNVWSFSGGVPGYWINNHWEPTHNWLVFVAAQLMTVIGRWYWPTSDIWCYTNVTSP